MCLALLTQAHHRGCCLCVCVCVCVRVCVCHHHLRACAATLERAGIASSARRKHRFLLSGSAGSRSPAGLRSSVFAPTSPSFSTAASATAIHRGRTPRCRCADGPGWLASDCEGYGQRLATADGIYAACYGERRWLAMVDVIYGASYGEALAMAMVSDGGC